MLFITTRNADTRYSLDDAFLMNVAPDGGYFIPVDLPICPQAMLQANSFSATIAEVLNLFFGTELTSWDVDFCIGRGVLRIASMNHKIAVAETWHNLEHDGAYVTKQLQNKLLGERKDQPSLWFDVLIKTAVYIGIYTQMLEAGVLHAGQVFDISLKAHDHAAVMAAYYARQMGLPIGTVIMACEEGSPIWEIVQRGSCTVAAQSDSAQLIEWMVYCAFGAVETALYRDRVSGRGSYAVPEEMESQFSQGMFCAVPGISRAADIINSVYRSNGYIIDPYTALDYGAVQDYRTRANSGCMTLLVSQHDPANFMDVVTKATGISAADVLKIMNPA